MGKLAYSDQLKADMTKAKFLLLDFLALQKRSCHSKEIAWHLSFHLNYEVKAGEVAGILNQAPMKKRVMSRGGENGEFTMYRVQRWHAYRVGNGYIIVDLNMPKPWHRNNEKWQAHLNGETEESYFAKKRYDFRTSRLMKKRRAA